MLLEDSKRGRYILLAENINKLPLGKHAGQTMSLFDNTSSYNSSQFRVANLQKYKLNSLMIGTIVPIGILFSCCQINSVERDVT